MRAVALLAAAVTVLPLTACGGAGETADPAASTAQAQPFAGAPIPGGGLSIEEAIESEADGPLMVRGYLVRRDGELRLCEALLESSPPQCGEPSLRVKGPAPAPAEARVSLLGEVEDGTIAVSTMAIG